MRVALAVSSLTLVALFAGAQLAGAEQEKSCRQQIDELCSESAPNTPERRACVKQGIDKLSPRCQQQLGLGQRKAEPAPRGPGGLQDLAQACSKDHPRMVELCQRGRPAGEDVMPCLRAHQGEFSEPCQKLIRESDAASAEKQAEVKPPGAPKPAEANPPGAAKPAEATAPGAAK